MTTSEPSAVTILSACMPLFEALSQGVPPPYSSALSTACYPANTDVTDYFYCINRMFKWVAKTLILTYWNYIDRGIKRRLIDAVVQSINDWLASLATDEKIIGGRVEFNESENSTSQLAAGIVRFHIYMTPPSPMQKMDFVLEYDLSYLAALVAA